ncbi:MAG: sugar ABC transporter substrate-binding protein [Phycisphaerae bacterium]|nr:sugar ABC transporter substrate-binding protein [Phycisphaerae bacterium]
MSFSASRTCHSSLARRSGLLCVAVSLAPLWAAACTRQKEDGRTEIIFSDHPYAHWTKANRRIIELFEAENPDVRVKFVPAPEEKLLGMIAGGVPPDVWTIDHTRLGYFARRGVLMRLDERIAESPDVKLDACFPCTVETCKYDGHFYGLPHVFSPVCLVYNKSLFREAGVPEPSGDWTWDEFLDACKRLTKDRDGDGRIDQFAIEIIWSYHRWPIFVWQNGGEVFDPVADKYVLDSPEAVEAIRFQYDLVFKHHVSPSQLDQLEGVSSQQWDIRFAEQRVAMLTSTRYYLGRMKGFGGFEVGVCHMPRGKKKSTIQIGSVVMVNANTRHADAAWRLAKFFHSARSQEIGVSGGRGLPSNIALAEKVTHHPGSPPDGDHVFVEAAAYCRSKDFEIAELRRANYEAWEIFYRIPRGVITAEEACRQFVDLLNPALRRYRATGGQG